MEDELFSALAERVHDPKRATDLGHGVMDRKGRPVDYIAGPPASAIAIEGLARHVGNSVPPPLARLLTTIGDGGFGPGYGLFSIAQITREFDRLVRPNPDWPSRIVPILEWGCGIFSCADFTSPVAQLFRYDPDVESEVLREWLGEEPVGPGLSPEAHDLLAWLSRWSAGEDLFDFKPAK